MPSLLASAISPLRRRGVLVLLSVLVVVILLVRQSTPTLGKVHWRSDWSWVDMGSSGMAPMRRYHSFDHDSVDVRFLARDDQRCSHNQLFVATRGSETEPGAQILDHTGELVWRQPRMAAEVHDFRVQDYKGQRFLTFWAGKPDGGGKQGSWYMMDDTYTIKHNISAPGFDFGDMHEFELTSNGTALVTIYNPVAADLTPVGGPAEGYLLDGVFQELDIETGQVLFQWNASDHIPLTSSRKPMKGCSDDPKKAFLGCGNTPDSAFDYYHINSVQKDAKGNYLVSGRHTSSLTYIDGKTGGPIWHMGGDQNQFKYAPLGTDVLFAWQHHARLHDDDTITLLDNNAYNPKAERTESRGLRLQVDFTAMTVELQTAYRQPQQIMAFSQGNAQVLDSGNVLVGWGSSAAFTEFAPDGEVLCDARFAPAALFTFQPLSSYRTYRGSWTGKPAHPPQIATARRSVYASWNGATEVASWRLQGRPHAGADFETILETPRERFETEFPAANLTRTYRVVRAEALSAGGITLGTTEEVEPPTRWSVLIGALDLLVLAGVGFVVLTCVGATAGCLAYRRRSQRAGGRYKRVDTNE